MAVSATHFSVRLLGPVQALRGTVPLDLGPRKQRAVFACLAVHAPERTAIDTIVDEVWGENPPASARHLVHTYIARLRKNLEYDTAQRDRASVVHSARGGYVLRVDDDQHDRLRFNRLTVQADLLLADGEWRRALEVLREAIQLWHDPALADLSDLLHERTEIAAMRREWLEAGVRYLTLGLDRGLAPAVLSVAECLAAAEPLHEIVQARYIAALADTGQRARAIEHYGVLRARLGSELGVAPGDALQATYQRILTGSDAPQPAAAGFGPVRPPWLGRRPGPHPLIDREADVDAVVQRLTHHRLVTVSGPPGCGKSALGLHVAARVRDVFADGVVVVDLAGTSGGPDMTDRVRRTLGISADGSDVVESVGERQILVVLDDAELLLDACATLVDQLVTAGPQVAAIVTSREPLGLPYESVWRVRPFQVPAEGAGALPDNPAVRMFVRRATQLLPDFQLDDDTGPAVSEICRRLDGIPLAIELAVASLPTNGLDHVLHAVADPLRTLRRPWRGLPAHHMSLTSALCRSTSGLTPIERGCFGRLGRLPPVFDVADAERVCRPCAGPDDVRVVLDRLVTMSLLSVRHGSTGPTYRMLAPVTQLAAQVDAGEPDGAAVLSPARPGARSVRTG